MFPLESTVLFPGIVIPLHVFEPRYRVLVDDCLRARQQLGVVLIERGREVGGGDTRFNLGTRAQIVEAAQFPDGRWALALAGVARIRVTRWLPDEPYPRAEVEDLVAAPPGPMARARRDEIERLLRRALAIKAELGEPAASATVDLAADPVLALAQAATLAPIGPIDAQRVLEAGTADEAAGAAGVDAQLDRLADLLADEVTMLARRAAGG
jgi:Lon protease-like protein